MEVDLLKQGHSSLQSGKTCTDDHVIPEMLAELDDHSLQVLVGAFRLRLLNHESEYNDPVWDSHLACLIQKKIKPPTIKDYRGIAIIAVLQKMYSKELMLLAGATVKS